MPFSGGTYTPPLADFPAVTNTVISSVKYDALINDIASALSNCVTRDGQSPPIANLPLASHKFTGAGDASSRDQYMTLGQLQDFTPAGSFIVAGTPGSSGDTITLNISPAPPAYTVNGTFYIYQSPITNVGAVTIRINALAFLTVLVDNAGFGPGYGAGYFTAGHWYITVLNTTNGHTGKMS